MAKKIRVGVLFGGKSAEHEVSLQSAKNIVEAIDQEKYEVVLIGIDKQGQWFLNDASKLLPGANSGTLPSVTGGEATVTLIPESKGGQLVRTSDQEALAPVDVIFPILHFDTQT